MKTSFSPSNTSFSVAVLNTLMIDQRIDISNVDKMLPRMETPLARIMPPSLRRDRKLRGFEDWEVSRFMYHYQYYSRKNNSFLKEVYEACENYILLIPHLERVQDEDRSHPVVDEKPVNTEKNPVIEKCATQMEKAMSKRGGDSILRVSYPNGSVVCHPTAVDTLVEVFCDAINKYGMQRVYDLHLRRRRKAGNSVELIVKGIPNGQLSTSYRQIPEHPQYYIRIKTETEEKMWEIEDLSDALGLGLDVEKIAPTPRKKD